LLTKTNSVKVLCTTCGKRAAFYYRQSSGEKLCPVCLEESLENHIKHSFSKRVKLGKNPVILTYIPPERVLEGFLLAYMLAKIEKKFGGVVNVASPRNVLGVIKKTGLNEYLGRNGNVVYRVIEETGEELECYTMKSLENSLRILEGSPDLIKGVHAILLPYTLTDLNEAFLEHVILGVGSLESLRAEKRMINGAPLILPYAQVDRVDVVALSHALKFVGLLNSEFASCRVRCRDGKLVRELVIHVTLKHPELTHTMLRSINFFSA